MKEFDYKKLSIKVMTDYVAEVGTTEQKREFVKAANPTKKEGGEAVNYNLKEAKRYFYNTFKDSAEVTFKNAPQTTKMSTYDLLMSWK